MIVIRMLRCGALALAVVLAVVSCGGPTGSGSAPTGGASGFPVTIQHKFGATTIDREPRRVVTVGFQEHDFVLALGVAPVAARYWYGPENDVIQPWAEQKAAELGANPTVLRMETLNFEAVAAQRPDLILGIYSGITADEYAKLAQIAPTVAAPAEFIDYGVPWQRTTEIIGRALGRSAAAAQLVQGVEQRFQAIRSANPQFAGKSVIVAVYGSDDIGFFASQDPRSRFFTALGFQVPAKFDQLAGAQFYGALSFEQIPELDQDLVVWDQLSLTPGGRATVEENALVQRMRATVDKRAIFLEGDIESAFGWNTVLSLPSALDGIEPQMRAAFPPGP